MTFMPNDVTMVGVIGGAIFVTWSTVCATDGGSNMFNNPAQSRGCGGGMHAALCAE